MKKTDLEELLHDVIAPEGVSSPVLAALQEARRRRRNRIFGRGCAIAAILMGGYCALERPTAPPSHAASPPPVEPAALPLDPTPPRTIKLMSDQELFAALEGLSYAVVGEPGSREILFLECQASDRH